MSTPSRQFVGFTAPSDLVESLKALATSRERTLSAELRYLIREHLAETETSPANTTEDVSRAVEGSPLGETV